MPRYSGVAFSIQQVEKGGKVQGFVVAGFFTKKQLQVLRTFVDNPEYQRTKKWRGEYQEMAQAIVGAIDRAG